MKKVTKILLVLSLLVLGCSTFFACKDKGEANSKGNGNYGEVVDSGGNLEEVELAYSQATMALIVGDETTPILNYTAKEGEKVSFSSSNQNVVAVFDDGKLTALNSGEATVTASYLGKTAQLNVTVGFGDFIPVLVYDNAYTSYEFSINRQDKLSLKGKISFNQKLFDDVSIDYTCSGKGKVENGIYQPDGIGTETVSLSAVWRGKEAYIANSEFVIHTIPAIEIYANDNSADEFLLYATDRITTPMGTFEFDTTAPFVLTATKDGEAIETVGSFLSGEDAVEFQSGIVVAKKKGVAEYKVSYTNEGVEYSKIFKFTVEVPVCPYNDEPIRFSAIDGTLEGVTYTDIFGDNPLISAKMGAQELSVESGAPMGYVVDGKSAPEARVLTVVTDTVGYEFAVIPYTKVLKTAQDIRDIFKFTKANSGTKMTDTTNFDGYYILADDIYWEGAAQDVDPDKLLKEASQTALHEGGLTGTFDGDGHAIRNMQVEYGGLFGLVFGGTIKNVAFTNLNLTGAYIGSSRYYSTRVGLAFELNNATLENVYMQASTIAANATGASSADGYRALVAGTIANNTKMNCCIFELGSLDNVTANYKFGYGSLCTVDMSTMPTAQWVDGSAQSKRQWTNVYVISPVELSVYANKLQDINYVVDSYNHKDELLADMYGWNGQTPPTETVLNEDGDIVLNPYTVAGKITPVYSYENGAVCDALGISRYDSKADMIAANKNYREFDGNIWTLDEEGIPVYNAIAGDSGAEDIALETTLLYDQSTGKIDLSSIVLSTGETVDNILFADGSYQTNWESDTLTINGLIANGQEYTMRIITSQTAYKVNVKMATKVFTTAEELRSFFQITEATVSGATVSSTNTFSGYYMLGNNITWDDTVHDVDKNSLLSTVSFDGILKQTSIGLTGIFDGNGYTVTGMKVTNGGLFGFVAGGTVKNVAFTNVCFEGVNAGTGDGTFGRSQAALSFSLYNAKVENVYIQADTIKLLATGIAGNRSLVTNAIAGTTDIIDSIFQLNGMEEFGTKGGSYWYGTLCGNDYRSRDDSQNQWWDNQKTYTRENWKNVYIIAPEGMQDTYKLEYAATEPTVYEIDGYNSETQTWEPLAAVKKFDSVTAATDIETAYWKVSGEEIVWTGSVA